MDEERINQLNFVGDWALVHGYESIYHGVLEVFEKEMLKCNVPVDTVEAFQHRFTFREAYHALNDCNTKEKKLFLLKKFEEILNLPLQNDHDLQEVDNDGNSLYGEIMVQVAQQMLAPLVHQRLS